MGSKINDNEGRQSCGTLATASAASCRQSKVLKRQKKQENPRLNDMIPSISKHRCVPSPSGSRRKHIGSHGQDLDSSPLIKAVELSSLVSTAVNKSTSSRHEQEEELFTQGDLESINEFEGEDFALPESEEFALPEEPHNEAGQDEISTPMIIDTGSDGRTEGCAVKNENGNASTSTFSSTAHSSAGDQSNKAFSPDRMPERSSMKGSEKARERPGSIRAPTETLHILLPGHILPIKRQRSIAFDNKINIQNIVPVRLLATGGPQYLWYQESEYEKIKFKTLALLDRVDHSSGLIDGKKYCTRGLEKFMTPEATEVKKHQAWDSVLNEQFLQRKDGEFDGEHLATIYMYSTKRSRIEARKRAKFDAEASEAYLNTTFRRHSSPDDGSKSPTNFDRRVSM
jgi:hypothetical protein